MKALILPYHERKTINWAHGISTELYIYPENGDFLIRDFTFRISTATVEAEETEFSSFSGITRTLIVLEGKLKLTHRDHYTKELDTYDQDTFMGDWNTISKGKVRDFNLMCKNGASGTVNHVYLEKNETIQLNPVEDFFYLFVAKGGVEIQGEKLKEGDTMILKDPSGAIELKSEIECDLIWGVVNCDIN